MKPRSLCALVLALALPALAQTQPQLEPLVPRKPSQPQLPPIEPLSRPPRGTVQVGVLVLGALPDGVSSQVAEGLRAVLKLAPSVKDAVVLDAPQPCTKEACWITAGAAANVGQVIVAAFQGGALRMKVVDVATRKQVGQAQRERVSSIPDEATAWAEALACQLLVPAGCTGQVVVDAPEGVELSLDGQVLRSGQSRMVPVGVHTLRIKEGDMLSSRPLPVLHERTNALALGAPPAPPAPAPVAAPVVAPVAAIAPAPAPAPRRTWTRTAGYVTAGVAVAAAATGLYFGAKSRSDLNAAESAYRNNGGAYQPGDLNKLQSGNSAAHTANALFIASGVLLAAGAVLTFAF
ncbi:MAG TPA: hypothetical protein VIH51_08595 [Myxococcales bacterium]